MSFGKDSISHESITDQKTKADDPSSVLHLSNSVRDSVVHSRGEPFNLTERGARCK
jgi:hypothetical protein